jgi:outer membrane immunogenic protein
MTNKLLAVAAASALLIVSSLGAARAADLPMKAAPVPAPIYTWTGWYVGLNAGYGLAEDPFSQTILEPGLGTESSSINSRVTPNGAIAGGQIGYNYQSGHTVVGVEGDFQWSGQRDTAGCGIECINGIGLAATVGSAAQNIKWFGTARGRLGWADNGWLLYITGGGAWAGVDATTAASESAIGIGTFAQSETTSLTRAGWVVGGGAEVRISGPWSAKFEYLYMDLGGISDTLTLTALGFGATASLTTNSEIHDHIVRVGVNYKLN